MKKYFILAVSALFLLSCNSGNDKKAATDSVGQKENNVAASNADNRILFKVDGAEVSSDGWIVQRFVWDEKTPAPWLNITSNMHKDKRTINVNLNSTKPATYTLFESGMLTNSHGAYFPDFSNPMESYSFTSGNFIITGVDTVKNVLNGTFSGVAKNSDGKIVTITDGQLINVSMKPGVNNLQAELDKLGN
ncbi:MAG: hypothetical protein JST10_00845 [Bacteroidetes bacterium]|nr:hypothetical protein [Bacteroidota bacterium]MBS1631097.1 hypothetical protein [Bacteroidota bacterium]